MSRRRSVGKTRIVRLDKNNNPTLQLENKVWIPVKLPSKFTAGQIVRVRENDPRGNVFGSIYVTHQNFSNNWPNNGEQWKERKD